MASSSSSDVAANVKAIAAKLTSTKEDELKLHELPREMIDRILMELARTKYDDISRLADIYHDLKNSCKDFMERNPRENFVGSRPAGLSDEDDDDGDDDDQGSEEAWNYDDEPDELDFLNDMLERFSYGSNYDEDVDDLLHGPDYANYDEAYGGEEDSSNVGGDHQPTYEVTEGW